MRPAANPQRLTRAAWVALGAAAGLAVAVIITLNVHIWVGLEQGYAATPSEVFDKSVVLGLTDIVLIVSAPIMGAVAAGKLGRSRRDLEDDDGPSQR